MQYPIQFDLYGDYFDTNKNRHLAFVDRQNFSIEIEKWIKAWGREDVRVDSWVGSTIIECLHFYNEETLLLFKMKFGV